ncbi:hypothetical protein CJ030_MR6G007892 [Morella rubra]|uniref:Uncharacterized protein n=1 Tax=Morella rubra TaxID=262757 RepID=A0A6A1V9X4_9ROSI|nr:hypothetical protein CJ030_MR6G007892 [Morella rubra]
MHLILCSAINPKKHTTELSYYQAEFMYLVVVQGELVDLASYIYQTFCSKALKTDPQISLPYGVLLTQFLHAVLVLDGADEPKPTHNMVIDNSSRLTAMERKIDNLNFEWKKEVAAIWSDLTGVASGAQLHDLTEQVVLI